MRKLDYKSHVGEIKDLDKKNRVVTGVLANWNMDKGRDIILPSAFNKTLAERGDEILFLNQHNWKEPHGFFAELTAKDTGLHFVSNPLPNTTYSNDALELYAQGIVKEHSIGFEVIKSDWDEDNEIRTIKEIRLYEGSNVTLGMNSETPFTGFKSMTMEELDDMQKNIIRTLRHGNLTDMTFSQLEVALKQLQTEAYKQGQKASSNQPDPSTDPQDNDVAQTINNFILSL